MAASQAPRQSSGPSAAKTAVRDQLLTARRRVRSPRSGRLRGRPRRAPARHDRGTPGRDRRGVRLDARRARHRPAPRCPSRCRQAGDPAGAAARRRPRLGGVRRSGGSAGRPARAARAAGERLGADAVATADVVLVPGLAVSADGMRLGRGGGSYDRALGRVPVGTFTCVLLYDERGRGSRCRPRRTTGRSPTWPPRRACDV